VLAIDSSVKFLPYLFKLEKKNFTYPDLSEKLDLQVGISMDNPIIDDETVPNDYDWLLWGSLM
jgi:hypothetical protein